MVSLCISFIVNSKQFITIWRRIIIFKKFGNVVLFSHEAAEIKSFENICINIVWQVISSKYHLGNLANILWGSQKSSAEKDFKQYNWNNCFFTDFTRVFWQFHNTLPHMTFTNTVHWYQQVSNILFFCFNETKTGTILIRCQRKKLVNKTKSCWILYSKENLVNFWT